MRQGGFTMIEMMFVIVVISVLATVAVVAYTKNARQARAAEVPQIFGELKTREEMYHAENAHYLPVCPTFSGTPVGISDCAEGDWFPATLPGKGAPIDYGVLPQRWLDLKVNMPNRALYCQYEVIAGLKNDRTQIGTIGAEMWGATTPTRNWFYLMAQCDWDGTPAVKAQYWQRDDWSELGKRNEGR
jgi:prepilin-type N-terminal cleavage/methylation domain-containing protein